MNKSKKMTTEHGPSPYRAVSLNNPNQSTTEYVVDLNKQLLKENQILIAKVTQLGEELKGKDEELEEKEEELGREEKSNNYLKSLLKNFRETAKINVKECLYKR